MQQIDFETQNQHAKNGKLATLILGGIVYLGVIVVATVLTIMFVTGILPADAYGLRLLITLGVIMVGLNAVALPVALHYWAVSGFHRALAIAFYAADMLILAVNMVTSFSTISGHAPAWVVNYEPYSVGMLVFALASWGILKIADPGERAALKLARAQADFQVKAIEKAAAYLDSLEGEQAVAQAAGELIPDLFNAANIRKRPRSWGNVPTGEGIPAENFFNKPPRTR
jgi:hypothetical protein